MAEENLELEALVDEFSRLTREISELLDDLRWRRPDVQEEIQRFEEAKRSGTPEGMGYVASMQTFIQIWTKILEEKEAELHKKARRWEELRRRIMEFTGQEIPPLPEEVFGAPVHQEKE